ncbi:MAG: arylesterase [Rhizobiaceae bacterium]|nr:arylesterase [Rhizobiaceae bacterium]
MNLKPHLYYGLVIFLSLLALGGPTHASNLQCDGKKLVILGDSLVAGYGLPPGEAYPEKLASIFSEQNGLEVVNAGVSGDTTSGGLARLEWSLGDDTDAVLLELGANDALRGIPVEQTRKNLDEIISKLKLKSINVMLAGMMAPPNMGGAYGQAFNAIYPELAEKHDVLLYPFFLDGVAAERDLNQSDGIHPNTKGIAVIVERSLPFVEKLLAETC